MLKRQKIKRTFQELLCKRLYSHGSGFFTKSKHDGFLHIPMACQMISQKLDSYGIRHFAEEYLGDHVNKLWTDDGRVLNDLLPFFHTYLKFE